MVRYHPFRPKTFHGVKHNGRSVDLSSDVSPTWSTRCCWPGFLSMPTSSKPTSLLPRQWLTSACDQEYDHLSDTIHRLKAFNAKRKWRAVAAVVMLGARLGLKKRARSASEEGREDKNGCEQPRFVVGLSSRVSREAFCSWKCHDVGAVVMGLLLLAILSLSPMVIEDPIPCPQTRVLEYRRMVSDVMRLRTRATLAQWRPVDVFCCRKTFQGRL